MKSRFPAPGVSGSKAWVGYNRLAIVDVSESGFLPFYDEARDCLFFMNGEIYNYKQLRKTFLADIPFRSETDTEVAFRLYLELGDSFVQQLRGMFAIAVVHPGKNLVKVWRDRLGIKPFYYSVDKDHFIFSSEIGGILATGMAPAEFDLEKLGHQLYLGASLSPATLYKNIFSLEPGCFLEVNTRSFEYTTGSYWQMSFAPSDIDISREEFLGDIKEIADLSLEGVDDIEKAVMLSGGLDSGLLAFFLNASRTGNITGCTIYNDSGTQTNELRYAAINAATAGIPLESFRLPPEMSGPEMEVFCRAEEEPNISPEPAYFLSSQLKGKKRILYNALGPDELFYGYGHHVKAMKMKRLLPLLGFAWDTLLLPPKKEKFRAFRIYGLAALPFISRSVAGWEEIQQLFRDHSSAAWQDPLELVLEQAKNRFADFSDCDIMKQLSFLDIYFYISSYHSLRSDRPAMLNHIEMRFPYLDHLFVQKYFNVRGLEKELSAGNYKPFFRKHARTVLDPEVFKMPKTGFNMSGTGWEKELNWKDLETRLAPLISSAAIRDFAGSPEKKWLLLSLSYLLPERYQ
ncbi:MAG: hypothetical protein KIT80_07360 [Chitinophagaceae bacterium]|nr:hypothetical protein [Chitinophagaceae bacterium]MCW5926709.1 hypothetical protein [Chitinophagaceae bacterium]